jgi:hypothetical protein
MRYLIRLASSRFDDWVNGKGDVRAMAESIFRPTTAQRKEYRGLLEDSTYSVGSHHEEIQVAAAHLLTGNDPKMVTRYLIRIRPEDAQEAGLLEDDYSLGETGVPWVDFRHRNLVGTKDQYQQLVEVILHWVQEGEDRVRRIGAAQDRFCFNWFLTLPTTEVPTCTRDLINCVLNNTLIAALTPDIGLARAEMAVLAIPHETVSLRAFCLEERGEGAGSPEATWYKALKQLREEYRNQYPHAPLGP